MPHAAHEHLHPSPLHAGAGESQRREDRGACRAVPADVGAIRRSSEERRIACGSFFDLTSGGLMGDPIGFEGRLSCALIQMGNWRVPAEAREPMSRRPGRAVPTVVVAIPPSSEEGRTAYRNSFDLTSGGRMGDPFGPFVTVPSACRPQRTRDLRDRMR